MPKMEYVNYLMQKLQCALKNTENFIKSELSYSKDLRNVDLLKEYIDHRRYLKTEINLIWSNQTRN
jgi:hypothetical protein